ncbi:hypothetical protein SNEBB_001681 [Seison nebaliae]|nr:hypothetical protein SNEBB_001681 [Seison nebaliae]
MNENKRPSKHDRKKRKNDSETKKSGTSLNLSKASKIYEKKISQKNKRFQEKTKTSLQLKNVVTVHDEKRKNEFKRCYSKKNKNGQVSLNCRVDLLLSKLVKKN